MAREMAIATFGQPSFVEGVVAPLTEGGGPEAEGSFDEFAAACGTLIEMSRSCGPNHASADEAPDPAPP